MFSVRTLSKFLLLPAILRGALAATACNNSPDLCDRSYDQVAYLGAHDSPFIRDESTSFSTSGNQFYSTTAQLAAGVRLLTAQVQLSQNNRIHVCHTSCDLLDAGSLSSWLSEVRSWMNFNPDEVVTILIVNGANASPSDLAAEYATAGITSSMVYTPSGSTADAEDWPTLQSLIGSGTRLVNFVDSLSYDTTAPWLMHEYDYIFENNYNVVTLDGFSCDAYKPSTNTQSALSRGLMPLMNHFLYSDGGFGIQIPAVDNITTTNSPGNAVGSLGQAAATCKQEYGQIPTYVLVDFFNVGPAIKTVDRLNGITNPVGRKTLSKQVLTSSAYMAVPAKSTLALAMVMLCFAILPV